MQSVLVYVPEVHGCNKITSSSHPLWRKNRKRASSALPSRQSSVVSRQRQASEAESEADAEADKSPKPRTENHLLHSLASSSSSFFFFFLIFFLPHTLRAFAFAYARMSPPLHMIPMS